MAQQDRDAADFDAHVYIAGRCIRCGLRQLEFGIYPGTETCPERDADIPVAYSTSPEGVVSSHQIPS